jgi:bacterioferritin
MIRINPDPHTGGYAYIPKRAVTAFFPSGQSPQPALRALIDAGFAEDRIEVFSGPKGAEQLDAEGHRHGLCVRFMRLSEESATDDYDMFIKADEILRSGGTVVAVFTLKDEDKKRRAVEIFKANKGEDVMYWGPWIRESYSLGPIPVATKIVTAKEMKPMLETDLRLEEEGAANYRRQAEQAGALGHMELKVKLEEMAADEARHAVELRRLIEAL